MAIDISVEPTPVPALSPEQFAAIISRLDRLERLVVDQRTIKDFYSVGEVAKLLGRAKFTVSEWCRLGRVEATKRLCGRSGASEWMIAHAEVERVKNEGLRPDPAVRRVSRTPNPSPGVGSSG